MTTLSSNIAGTVQPFAVAGHGRRAWPYGSSKVYKIDEIVPGKKEKGRKLYYGQLGMLYVNTGGRVQEAYTEPVGRPEDGFWKIPSLGKVGVWRTVGGRRHFFPVDGSSPVPKIRGSKKSNSDGGGSAGAPKKKGVLSKIMGLLGGGGGAKASVKDAKPKKGKSKGAESKGEIEGSSELLKQTDSLLLKASRTKGGKSMIGPLKKMKAALAAGDEGAFKKAEASLAKSTQKLAKKKGA